MIEILPDVWLYPGPLIGFKYSGEGAKTVTVFCGNGNYTHTFTSRREAEEWMQTVRLQLEAVDEPAE